MLPLGPATAGRLGLGTGQIVDTTPELGVCSQHQWHGSEHAPIPADTHGRGPASSDRGVAGSTPSP